MAMTFLKNDIRYYLYHLNSDGVGWGEGSIVVDCGYFTAWLGCSFVGMVSIP